MESVSLFSPVCAECIAQDSDSVGFVSPVCAECSAYTLDSLGLVFPAKHLHMLPQLKSPHLVVVVPPSYFS